jgi:hypothetical protein
MITNQILLREEGFIQRTKDGYFNASSLIKLWNSKNSNKKLLQNFKSINETKDFIKQLKLEGIDSPYISKGGRFSDGITWMHPKLFIDLAMWISVEFKSKVIDMVLDGLILSRNEAGDYYNEMTACILDRYVEFNGCKPPATIFINEANLIKKMAGVEGKDRNEMTAKELCNITVLQRMNAQLIRNKVGKDSRIKQLTVLSEGLKY